MHLLGNDYWAVVYPKYKDDGSGDFYIAKPSISGTRTEAIRKLLNEFYGCDIPYGHPVSNHPKWRKIKRKRGVYTTRIRLKVIEDAYREATEMRKLSVFQNEGEQQRNRVLS